MAKLVRNGIGGEVTWEVFETMIQDKPELLLADFLRSNRENLFLVIPINEDHVGMININRMYAAKLLRERAELLLDIK